MNIEEIYAQFRVPVRRGARVEFQGKLGTITKVYGLAVRVRLDGMTLSRPYLLSELQWLDQEAREPQAGGEPSLA